MRVLCFSWGIFGVGIGGLEEGGLCVEDETRCILLQGIESEMFTGLDVILIQQR